MARVHLTFDNGPDPAVTPHVLQVLERRGVDATFFVLGKHLATPVGAELAREAEICYATVAMVTDYDCWHPEHGDVDVPSIIWILQENAANAARLVARVAQDFPAEHEACPDGSDRCLDTSIITPPEARDPAVLARLDAIAGRVINPAG